MRVETTPLPRIAGGPSELREALTNILLNALDAMPQGGRITFETRAEGDAVGCVPRDGGDGREEVTLPGGDVRSDGVEPDRRASCRPADHHDEERENPLEPAGHRTYYTIRPWPDPSWVGILRRPPAGSAAP